MNKIKLLLVAMLTFTAFTTLANSTEDDIAERIKKVGSVCVEGSDCASATATTVTVAAGDTGSSGAEDNFNKTCATCHATGVAGAPKFGDAAAWAPRIAKGMDALYASAINGKPPAMPAKGMCFSCSEDDLKAIVDYMTDHSK